ncbi:MAG: ECF-type sigma factor [Acidobacteria bacterium]|nr:ECF-type sigma factor [Acidobacteriota bacterium]
MADSPSRQDNVTDLLQRAAQGDKQAESDLYAAVAPRILKMAGHLIRGERRGYSLQATELFHEAYGRLKLSQIDWQDRRHFYRVMSTVMRHVLLDRARKASPERKWARVELGDWDTVTNSNAEMVLLVEDLIIQLEKTKPKWARSIEMKFYAGCKIEEIAGILRCSEKTIKRYLADGLERLQEIVGYVPPPDDPPTAGVVATPPGAPPPAPPRSASA